MSLDRKIQTLILSAAVLLAFLATLTAARWLDDKSEFQNQALVHVEPVRLNQQIEKGLADPKNEANPLVELTSVQTDTDPSGSKAHAAKGGDSFLVEPTLHQETDSQPLPNSDAPLASDANENFVFAPMPAFPSKPSGKGLPSESHPHSPPNLSQRPSVAKTAAATPVDSPDTQLLVPPKPTVEFQPTEFAAANPSENLNVAEQTPTVDSSKANLDQGNQWNPAPVSSTNIPTADSPQASTARPVLGQTINHPTFANSIVTDNAFDPSYIAPASANLTEPIALPFENQPFTNHSTAPLADPQPKKPANSATDNLPHVLHGAKNYKLAEQPKLGEHYRDDRPVTAPNAHLIDSLKSDFSPGPSYETLPYLGYDQRQIYEGKKLYANQRPLLELGRPWYQLGQLSEGYDWFGKHNTISPQFLVYGDYRSAVASNSANGDNRSLIASELNLDIDLKLTGTERFHAFVSPLDDGVRNTRYLLDDDKFESEFDANIDFGYFEGDLGSIVGGFIDETMPFDMPFAIGVMPLLLQNGVWMEDAFLGVAATIPARNSPRFNISNMDTTFFAGYDKISSDAFPGDDSAARMYGVATFVEAMNGYFEIDYAFLDDRTFDDRSYHNFGFGYSRRYGRLVSNSTRVIVNAGQSNATGPNTADGVLLLSENSLITGAPSSLVPYFNLFAGFDRPQSAARAVQAGGVLKNTGILFETDGMTDYPTLDPTANDTYGGALGINLIADDFSQQLVLEMAMLGVMGNEATRNAPGEQLGVGFRYQLPLTNAIIFRADGMYGFLDDQPDVRGLRFELRQKW